MGVQELFVNVHAKTETAAKVVDFLGPLFHDTARPLLEMLMHFARRTLDRRNTEDVSKVYFCAAQHGAFDDAHRSSISSLRLRISQP